MADSQDKTNMEQRNGPLKSLVGIFVGFLRNRVNLFNYQLI